jgi:2-hydroxyacyl-CoA lyase 1
MSLTANIRYEKFASAFKDFKGYYAQTTQDINEALTDALKQTNKPSLINIAINPSADRKKQVELMFLFL